MQWTLKRNQEEKKLSQMVQWPYALDQNVQVYGIQESIHT